jgi:uncharacterized protein
MPELKRSGRRLIVENDSIGSLFPAPAQAKRRTFSVKANVCGANVMPELKRLGRRRIRENDSMLSRAPSRSKAAILAEFRVPLEEDLEERSVVDSASRRMLQSTLQERLHDSRSSSREIPGSRLNLNLEPVPANEYRITGYGDDYVVVGSRRFDKSVIVMNDRLKEWDAPGFDSLLPRDFELLRELSVEIVLLGTGRVIRFPAPKLVMPLHEAGIGLEVMDTRAACRTYNLLTGEGRRAAAALLIGS